MLIIQIAGGIVLGGIGLVVVLLAAALVHDFVICRWR